MKENWFEIVKDIVIGSVFTFLSVAFSRQYYLEKLDKPIVTTFIFTFFILSSIFHFIDLIVELNKKDKENE